jgi:hypothetical protein
MASPRAARYCAGDQLCAQGETYSLSLWLPRHGSSQATLDGAATDPLTNASLPRSPSDTAHFLCLITPLCSYLYGGLYGGCMRDHI